MFPVSTKNSSENLNPFKTDECFQYQHKTHYKTLILFKTDECFRVMRPPGKGQGSQPKPQGQGGRGNQGGKKGRKG